MRCNIYWICDFKDIHTGKQTLTNIHNYDQRLLLIRTFRPTLMGEEVKVYVICVNCLCINMCVALYPRCISEEGRETSAETSLSIYWIWFSRVVASRTVKQANFFVTVVKPRIIYAIT